MEFKEWPKIPRLSKERVTVTEKLDGSNSAVRIRPVDPENDYTGAAPLATVGRGDHDLWDVWAQSRKRLLEPTKAGDNFGFAKWVVDNAQALVDVLGSGDHYGEWWGQGIQRSYGLKERRFSLFNAPRWYETLHPTEALSEVSNLYIVPTLYAGEFDGAKIAELKEQLRSDGSQAVPGFKAEGMVVYLRELNASYKVLLENDDLYKWQVEGV